MVYACLLLPLFWQTVHFMKYIKYILFFTHVWRFISHDHNSLYNCKCIITLFPLGKNPAPHGSFFSGLKPRWHQNMPSSRDSTKATYKLSQLVHRTYFCMIALLRSLCAHWLLVRPRFQLAPRWHSQVFAMWMLLLALIIPFSLMLTKLKCPLLSRKVQSLLESLD